MSTAAMPWESCKDANCKLAYMEHWHCPKEVPRKLVFPDGCTLMPIEAVQHSDIWLEFHQKPEKGAQRERVHTNWRKPK